MKLEIKKFKTIDSISIQWNKIQFSWKNWVWKTTILNAVEYVLFWTVWWKSKDLWLDKHSVVDFTYLNNVWTFNNPAKLPKFIRDIVFCDLLNQEPSEIKETLSNLIINDEMWKWLFWNFWTWEYWKTKDLISKNYNSYKKSFQEKSIKVWVLQEQLDSYSNQFEESDIEELEFKIKTLSLDISHWHNIIDINWLMSMKEWLENELDSLKDDNLKLTDDINLLNSSNKLLENNLCPICKWFYEDKELLLNNQIKLNKLIDKQKDTYSFINKLKEDIISITKTISDSKDIDNQNNFENQKNILEQYKSDLIRLNMIKSNMSELENQIDSISNELIELWNDPINQLYSLIKPDWRINKIIQNSLEWWLEWFKFIFFEESKWEMKPIFRLEIDWEDYKYLSRAERYLSNIKLSKFLLSISNIDLPLLLDDMEMFDSENLANVLELLSDNNYLLTSVKSNLSELTPLVYS